MCNKLGKQSVTCQKVGWKHTNKVASWTPSVNVCEDIEAQRQTYICPGTRTRSSRSNVIRRHSAYNLQAPRLTGQQITRNVGMYP